MEFLSSPRVTDWGDWGDFEYCPEDTFVVGMRLKTEADTGPQCDNTALNGIRFMCGIVGESQKMLYSPERQIQSFEGNWGRWGAIYECPRSYAVGFQLRSESGRGGNDDTAANNLRIFCSNSIEFLEGNGLSRGDWTETQRCPFGWAICGMRTQIETPQGNSDDTALNNLDIQCCKLPQKDEL
ncbi:Vitelline membrane outer layer protein 1 [Orchesella cincta]|uniref:Vitelline membrane outer layer protein 1 n=1 Tax=Orchesella cincta TaxID=48709 RepID=A0A1D2MWB1_ORCCI|nr:Vitelline membrane outer layer protein 1 [Orchesella cincta]